MKPAQLPIAALALALAGCADDSASSNTRDDAATAETTSDAADPDATDAQPDAEETIPPWTDPPACGTGPIALGSLVPGAGDPDFEAALASKALGIEKIFHGINAFGVGVNADVSVPLDNVAAREAVAAFASSDSWDFADFSGLEVTDAVSSFGKVAGAYAGVGIAADAFRYGVLRDAGAECAEIDRARQHLLAALDALHLATAITGTPGVIARGFARADLAGDGEVDVVPLRDSGGNPLPEEKNNGTWRADNSGLYPNYKFEDSCSRDMLIGWTIGMAAAWEVIAGDASIATEYKTRLQSDAHAIGESLMVVRESGYDLEIRDADGRMTYHGILNENAIDRSYFPNAKNGFYAIMSLGIVSALSYVSQDERLQQYLEQELVGERKLVDVATNNMITVDMGIVSNFSNYNMAFQGGWLATRYLSTEEARNQAGTAVATALYSREGATRQPSEQLQAFYDLVYLAASSGADAWGDDANLTESPPFQNFRQTLNEYPQPPYWDLAVENCDAAEIETGSCLANDGTPLTLLGEVGRGDKLVSEEPVPMRIRPPSNYHWRSNPYEPNGGGDGSRLMPSVDFRFVYWAGRWIRRAEGN